MHKCVAAMLAGILATAGFADAAYAQTSPSAYTSATSYDALGRVTGTIAPDPDGSGALTFEALRATYDLAGRPVKQETGELAAWQPDVIAPSAWTGFTVLSSSETTYDAMGRKTKDVVKGSAGAIVSVAQHSYDTLGRPECTARRMNPVIYASLPSSACALGAQGTGANDFGPDRITKNIYDAASQLLQVRKAVGTPLEQAYATYDYSSNGKQTAVIDANGNKAALTYDGFDRQSRWTFPSKTALTQASIATFTAATPANALTLAGAENAADYEAYTYDANGNRTKLRKRDGQEINYSYDALNRVTVKDIPGGTAADVYYGYDLRGLQLYARYGSASGLGVTHAYDGLGRLTSSTNTTDGVSRSLAYEYDANGNRTRLTFPDATAFSYAYDGLNRMTEIREGTAGPSRATIAYDNVGRRSGVARAGADSMGYVYDTASRLKTLSHVFTTTTNNLALDFEYNPASQMVKRTVSNDVYAYRGDYNLVRPYAANGLNQYTTAGPATFTYDLNGNLTGDGSSIYVYDTENRLASASGAKTATLKYDPMGRLNEISGGSAGVTRFLYDGDALVGEYDAGGTLLRRYVHGPGVDEPLVWYEGATLTNARSLHANHQGSVIALADNAGALLNANSYDAYGIPALTNLGRFAYTGQIMLPELGMYHYKARIYSPTLGRFLQTDPIGYKDQVNLYAYVGNDPVNKIDPAGKWIVPLVRLAALVCAKSASCRAFVARGIEKARESFKREPERGDGGKSAGQTAEQEARRRAPPGNDGDSKPHGSPKHDAEMRSVAEQKRAEGHTDIRTNQVQTDAQGNVAGDNRPDVQSTNPTTGQREHVEIDRSPANGARHQETILRNDPNSKCTLLPCPK